jgi:hypothetical protein
MIYAFVLYISYWVLFRVYIAALPMLVVKLVLSWDMCFIYKNQFV